MTTHAETLRRYLMVGPSGVSRAEAEAALTALEQENAKLRQALRDIDNGTTDVFAMRRARAALTTPDQEALPETPGLPGSGNQATTPD